MLLISIFVLLLGLGIVIVNVNARADAKNCSDKVSKTVLYNIYVGSAVLFLGCLSLFFDISRGKNDVKKFSF